MRTDIRTANVYLSSEGFLYCLERISITLVRKLKTKLKKMKIIEFSYSGGEKDWVFAPDIQEAKDFYLKFTGCGDLTLATVKEIPKDKWNQMYLLDPNESEPDEDEEDYNEEDYSCGLKIIETFAEYAQRNTITDMIATTEY